MCTDAMLYEESNVNVPQQNNEILILTEPVDTIAPIGSYVSLSASIVANSPILQWFDKFGNQVPHANQNSLTFQSVRRRDYGFYRLEVTERFTPPRKLTNWVELKAPPQLYRDVPTPVSRPILQRTPMGGMFHQGERVELVGQFLNATYYQWYLNGTALYGCTSSSLLIPNANLQCSGEFLLRAVNGSGPSCVSVKVQIC